MSNIYIQEPPTSGKVLLETTVGDIDIELWSRESPKACRNFIQLCMEGYYNGTIFHRVVKEFIAQGGDPTGTGTGGNSIYGQPFKDEFHSRLRFTRRGLLAMANAGKDDNGSQFFFTLAPTPELQNKHTIFGKVSGNTIYNMIKLEEGAVDQNDRPTYPHKILQTKILNNPFDDIEPREVIKREKSSKKSKQITGTKNYKLLSFGEEAEEAEEEDIEVSKKFTGKGKSSHDLTNDSKLSTQVALALNTSEPKSNDLCDIEEDSKLTAESVRQKLKKRETGRKSKLLENTNEDTAKASQDSHDEEEEYYLGKTEQVEKQKKLHALRKEFKELKKEMKKTTNESEKQNVSESGNQDRISKLASENHMVKTFLDDQKKYREKKTSMKILNREAATLALLAKFQKKIETAKETYGTESGVANPDNDKPADEDEGKEDDSWLARNLHYQEEEAALAKDANLKSDDWFEIYDPRNPINKRRRGEDSKSLKKRKS